jgi:hypothetical protein
MTTWDRIRFDCYRTVRGSCKKDHEWSWSTKGVSDSAEEIGIQTQVLTSQSTPMGNGWIE